MTRMLIRCFLVLAAIAFATPAHAKDFFKGKTISLLVAGTAGLAQERGLSHIAVTADPRDVDLRQLAGIGFNLAPEISAEIVTAIQQQLDHRIVELRERLGLTYLLISHNLAIVEHMATTSPEGATIMLWPIMLKPSSSPALATPTAQVAFW